MTYTIDNNKDYVFGQIEVSRDDGEATIEFNIEKFWLLNENVEQFKNDFQDLLIKYGI